jgi:uncharacterized protein involved in exopolysaccharide biosynthesis
MEQNDLSLERVIASVLRRKKAFLVSFLAGAVTLGAIARSIPPRYKAQVVLTIEPGRFPNDFLRPNVIPGLESRLGGMEKMLVSAPVIEELRARTGLAARDGPGGGLLEMMGIANDPIESWRKSFEFEVLQGEAPTTHKVDEAVVVQMSFKHADPEMASRVVNGCAARANEENNRFRRAFVEEVVRFVQKEEERARLTVHEREDGFNSFKLSNSDKLPEQEPLILARLGQLRIRYADLKNAERFADARLEQLTSERGLLVAQIALIVQIAATGGDVGDHDSPLELRRERVRLIMERDIRADELKSLEAQFTPRTPQVVIAKDRLDTTETRLRDVEAKLATFGVSVGELPEAPAPRHADVLDFDGKEPGRTMPGGLEKVPVKLPGDSAPVDSSTTTADKGAPKGAAAHEPKVLAGPTPDASANRVVQVLANPPLDEKTLEKSLDSFAYRLVVGNPGYARIRTIDFALKETKDAIAETVGQREESFRDIRKAEEQLASVPEVRQRLEALARALFEGREDFARLQNQLDNAQKALEVENEGKGEQLRVIDFARPPTKPTGPGTLVFVGIALVLALGLAVGACVLLETRKSASDTRKPAS